MVPYIVQYKKKKLSKFSNQAKCIVQTKPANWTKPCHLDHELLKQTPGVSQKKHLDNKGQGYSCRGTSWFT